MVTKAGPRSGASKTTRVASKRAKSAAAPTPKPVVVEDTATEPKQPALKRQELLSKVVARSDVKKKFAKPVLEAALAVIGEALGEGRELNLAPLGKVKVNRSRQLANGRVFITRIRQTTPAVTGVNEAGDKDAKESVADPAE